MADYRLWCMGESGNAYKAALMLELCGLPWEPVWVDFFHGETRTTDFRAKLNEMGEVPVLEHDGKHLTQSGVILDYLATLTGRFGAHDEDERREIWRWILFDNHKLTASLATLRYLIQFAKTGETPVTEFLRARAVNALKIVDHHMEGRSFVLGERCTIADLSMVGYLYYGDELTVPLADFPHMAAWLQRIKAMPGWKHPYELMPSAPKGR
ncbi:glutathione S-transferase [Aestuariivirga litoralis]|uniref:Glutathione S-transferase n=1 Tax=Aestuariivirga litoralis TaxID=2650924 RepID=A0A2W2BQ59_9HYPH|nr:glutathione S-transferase [Aestuariivirga litoralis]PZF77857.1 glutathione S-transferase [Aestuariivirga litoralis]